MNKCTNPNGHEFTPIEWMEEIVPPLNPGNTSTDNPLKRKVVVELMCVHCEKFTRINRK